MALGRWKLIFAILLGVAARAFAEEPEPDAGLEPIFTRQALFSIPFRIDAPPADGPQPAVVRLFVSEDQGKKWRVESEVKPDQTSFRFDSNHDGEFWFLIRTIDNQGRSHPDGRYEPQLKVVIDTKSPRLELNAERGADGEVVANWKVLDTGLKPDSFRLEYQVNGGNWQPLALDPEASRTSKLTIVGKASWWLNEAEGPLLLRATVSDVAGNSAVSQAEIKGSPPALRGVSPRGQGREPQPATGGGQKLIQWPAEDTSATLGWTGPGGTALAGPSGGRDSSWRGARPEPREARFASSQRTMQPSGAPEWGTTVAGNSTFGNGRETGPAAQSWNDSRPTTSPQGWDQAPAGPGERLWSPEDDRPRLVNQTTFEIDYEVESAGNSGVAKVELWGTRDEGKHWSNFGPDNDNRSPLTVTVDGEGLYGFCIVVQSGNGLSGQPPRDGDPPDVRIGVDLTRPQARITGIEPGFEGGELNIRWEANDRELESRPISLFFSDRPQGPWTPIASALDNVGSYTWRLDNRVGDRVYLRLEARDAAGNVGLYETPDPVTLDRHRPQGRIRGVRPAGTPQPQR